MLMLAPAPTSTASVTCNNYDMTTSFGVPPPPVPSGVPDEYRRMTMAASKENQTISKENQTIMAQQGALLSTLVKGMDKAAARASLPDILHGPKAISSKREFMTAAPRYTFCELTTHLRTTQARAKAPAAAKKTASFFARQETKLLSEIRSGAYTGPGSAQSLGTDVKGDASDLQGGENYCQELLRRFYEYWDNTFDTVEKTENTARQRDFCTRTRLDLRMANDASVQDCFDEVGSIAALYHEHNIPFTYDDEWDLFCLRMKCRRIRETIPLTPYIVTGIAARTMTCALFKRWVTTTFHIDPDLPMSDPRNVGQGDAPHELLVITDEEGLKRPVGTAKPKKKPTPRKPGATGSTFAPSGYTAASFSPVTQSVWAEVGESPVVEALTEAQAAIPYDLSKPNVKRFFEATSVADLQGRCFLTPHVTEFHWKPARNGAPPVKVCRCVKGLGGDIGSRSKEDLAMWMLDLTGQVDTASAETAFTAAKTCRTPNETWIAKGNYRQHLHQKEVAALPASVQSLSAKTKQTTTVMAEIGRKSRKLDKYQQIGQSLGAPTFVEAIQAMTPEMRQSAVVLGPIFAESVTVPGLTAGAAPCGNTDPACHNSFAALTSTITSDSEDDYDFFDDNFFDALSDDDEEEARAAQSQADYELALHLEAADEEEAAKCRAATALEAAPPARPNNTPPSSYVYPTEPDEGGPSGWPTQPSTLTTGSADDEEAEARAAQIQADYKLALRFKAADALARGPKPTTTTVGGDEAEVGEWETVGNAAPTYAQATRRGRRPSPGDQRL
jgi:hypothetical protein